MEQERTDEVSDEVLVRAVRDGQVELYAALIEKYQQRLYVYCYHLLMQREEAEDAMQDVLIKAYEKLSLYAYHQSFSAWLYKMAYHHCLNLLKKRKRAALLTKLLKPLGCENTAEGVETTIRKEDLARSLLALRRLTAAERSLIVLRVMEGRSYEEIGQAFPQSPAALRKRVERATAKLKKIWGEMEMDEEEEVAYGLARESEIVGRSVAPHR
ncbi:RNA polymerase sigma factor [Paenibacillus cymbidii]|uniref:RNA polymerase sigma factor n=1 Tax=Paenibacillus cymbidii TaxID=1639034 RepID=UPI0010800F78|nr:sigma-70 family RNA polymerase sigma factor [Paenibacillus cymbidii]